MSVSHSTNNINIHFLLCQYYGMGLLKYYPELIKTALKKHVLEILLNGQLRLSITKQR